MVTEVKNCRICGNSNLVDVCDFGIQALTGVFPKSIDEKVSSGPLKLTKCHGQDFCGLLQLKHSYDQGEMYGENYGYRSGLNKSMVNHLKAKVEKIEKFVDLSSGDIILDIGSNDSTLLQSYSSEKYNLIGIDPTGIKFKDYYPSHITLVPDFFNAKLFKEKFPQGKAKAITSISMFYDLESPIDFVNDIYEILDDEGVWVFEQSYMPFMLETKSFDTACHEHLEYYAFKQIKWMLDKVGMKVVDLEFNDINGGSFSIMAAKKESNYTECFSLIQDCEKKELELRLDDLDTYKAFNTNVVKAMNELKEKIAEIKNSGKTIYGLGASTKGNVLLQFCGLGPEDLGCIGEVNEEKFGLYTPGTEIPIIPEDELLEKNPDYLLVLPWHFSGFFKSSSKFKDVKLLFPLPHLEVYGS